jgi:uncharacterized protein (TIGR02444 family)
MTSQTLYLKQLPFAELRLDNPFWQFSLKLWQHKDIQTRLLQLQDNDNVKINSLLFAMWLGLEKKSLGTLNNDYASWHALIVEPLRCIRKHLPANLPNPEFKAQIQSCELQAEQIDQALLFYCSHQTPVEKKLNTLEVLTQNLLASKLSKSDLLLFIQACLPAHPIKRITQCIASGTAIEKNL